MKVAHFVPALFGPSGVRGGAERYAYALSLAMSNLVSTTLIAYADQRDTQVVGKLRVELFRPQWVPFHELHNAVSVRILESTRGADIVHCHQASTLSTELLVLWSRLHRNRVFVTPHGGDGKLFAGKFVPVLRLVDGYIAQSRFALRSLPRSCGVSSGVVRGGVDLGRFTPKANRGRAGHVLFVGRLLPHKGINYLIDALRFVRLPVTLTIAGTSADARFLSYLEQRAAGLPVEFVLGASDDDIIRLYHEAMVTVLPSVYRTIFGQPAPFSELLGLTLLESMACGTPVICTDVGGMPEYVRHRRTGLVVPPNDPQALAAAIDEMMTDRAWIERAPAECQAAALRFDWSIVARRCLEIYEGVENTAQSAPEGANLL